MATGIHTLKYYQIIFFIFLLASCTQTEVAPKSVRDLIPNEHRLLGNPSQTMAGEANANNYLLQKPQYTLPYSRERGTPNWVSWHGDKDWLGNALRQDDFRADNSLPSDWYKL